MGKYSRDKGARGERMWRDVCRDEGYDAERGCQLYQKGSEIADVIGLPGIHQEIKFTEKMSLRTWMRQAINDARPNEIPIVAHKQSLMDWLVTMRASDFFRLYREFTPEETNLAVGRLKDEIATLRKELKKAKETGK